MIGGELINMRANVRKALLIFNAAAYREEKAYVKRNSRRNR